MWGRSDLALARDPSTRFLPGLLAVMVFLAMLATAGGLGARSFVADWDRRLAGVLTVQIPPVGDGPAASAEAAERRDTVLRLLQVTPGVAQATVLPRQATAALLEPWLGPDLVDALPLPTLVDVRLASGQPLDAAALAQRLENAAPGTTFDDHDRWLADARALGHTIAVAGLIVLVLVGLAAVMAVVFAVRTGLSVHRDEIEVLHLIGAPDGYIARQFQWHTARLALVGALIGAILGVGTLAGIGWLVRDGASAGGPAGLQPLLASLSFGPLTWLALAALPLAAIGIATITARASVLLSLSRLS